MDGAKNASRLGGLTLAVGLGIAVSSGQGVAHADSDDSGSPGSSVSSRSSASDSTTSTRATQREQRTTARHDRSRTTADADTADDKQSVPADPPGDAVVDEPPVGDDATLTPDPDVELPPDDTAPAPGEDLPPIVAPVEIPAATPTAPPTAGAPTGSDNGAAVRPDDPTTETTAVDPPSVASSKAAATGSDTTAGSSLFSVKQTGREALSARSSVADVAPAGPESAAITGSVLSPLAELAAIPGRIVTGLLAWIGLGPSATAPGSPAAPIMKLVELAWVAMRRINSFFFNSTPTATVTLYEPVAPGVIAGRVIGVDADGDRLIYRVLDGPANGTVTLAPDGSFTYTTTLNADGTIAPDSFRVAVIDTGFHLHGLLSIFKPALGHASVATINLDPAAFNGAPRIEPVSTVTTPGNGVVTGTVRITDRDNDLLNVSVTQPNPAHGTVVLSKLNDNTWQWTFTPTAQARLDARDATTPLTAAFTITAGDGRSVASLPIAASISPEPESPPIVLSHEIIVITVTTPTLTIKMPDTGFVVVGQQSLLVLNPDAVPTQTINLPSPVLITHTNTSTGELIITDEKLSVTVLTSSPSGLVVTPTGITLDQAPTDVTTVGSQLVTTTGTGLSVYNNTGKLTVSGLPDQTEFKQVETLGTNDEIVVTHGTAVSRLMLFTDLGPASRGVSAANPGVTVEVNGTVDFGAGIVGELAVQDDSIYVTVTEGGVTRLVKIYSDYYGGLEEASSVQLSGSASSLAISADGRYAYVGDDATGTVSIIAIHEDYYGMDVLETVNAGPGRVSALPDGGLVITDPAAGTMSIIKHGQPDQD